jgi:hypothetical protein
VKKTVPALNAFTRSLNASIFMKKPFTLSLQDGGGGSSPSSAAAAGAGVAGGGGGGCRIALI